MWLSWGGLFNVPVEMSCWLSQSFIFVLIFENLVGLFGKGLIRGFYYEILSSWWRLLWGFQCCFWELMMCLFVVANIIVCEGRCGDFLCRCRQPLEFLFCVVVARSLQDFFIQLNSADCHINTQFSCLIFSCKYPSDMWKCSNIIWLETSMTMISLVAPLSAMYVFVTYSRYCSCGPMKSPLTEQRPFHSWPASCRQLCICKSFSSEWFRFSVFLSLYVASR